MAMIYLLTDNILFSTLTMNTQALHLDGAWASGQPFGARLVNSLFTLGVAVGLSVGDTTLGTTVGNLGFDETRFPNPVFIGDTIYAFTEVKATRESKSRPDWGIVTFEHRGMNQRDEVVCEVRRTALMSKRPTA